MFPLMARLHIELIIFITYWLFSATFNQLLSTGGVLFDATESCQAVCSKTFRKKHRCQFSNFFFQKRQAFILRSRAQRIAFYMRSSVQLKHHGTSTLRRNSEVPKVSMNGLEFDRYCCSNRNFSITIGFSCAVELLIDGFLSFSVKECMIFIITILSRYAQHAVYLFSLRVAEKGRSSPCGFLVRPLGEFVLSGGISPRVVIVVSGDVVSPDWVLCQGSPVN